MNFGLPIAKINYFRVPKLSSSEGEKIEIETHAIYSSIKITNF